MTQGVVFGTFDRFHPGHQWFLKQATERCDHLIVSVACDEDVQRRKQHQPFHSLAQRIKCVQEFLPEATVIEGDASDGQWTVLQQNRIDCCIIGYDQQRLADALQQWTKIHHYALSMCILEPYLPQRYKSSLYV